MQNLFIEFLLIAGLTSLPTAHSTLPEKNPSALVIQGEATKQRLIDLGYFPSIAQKLVTLRPELVEIILSTPPPASSPSTLYRTLDVPPEQFDPAYSRQLKNLDGSVDLSTYPNQRLTLLHLEAHGRNADKEVIGTLLEIQVPQFMIAHSDRCSPILEKYIQRNLAPFIHRIASVKRKKNAPFTMAVPQQWLPF